MTLSERGALLRKERLRLQLSLYRAAMVARVHPNTIMLAERGATSEATLERIVVALQSAEARGAKP